jgi:hypothetical protein
VGGTGLILAGVACAGGCAALAPLAVQWGADLVSAASQNYSRQYSNQLEGLLLAIYSDQAARRTQGRVPPGPGGQGQDSYPPSAQGSPYPQGPQSPYDSPQAQSGAPQNDPYPRTDPYPTQSAVSGGQPGPYPGPQQGQGGPGSAKSGIVLDAAILAQRASERAARRSDPVPIQDGEVLRDGGSDPRKGDVVKFSFRANCDCYVYIIGVDATGYVARVFPDPASRQGNPVRANRQYVVPEGTAWYGLDQHKGVEQVFYIASRRPRRDLESSLSQLEKTPKSSLSKNFKAVREAVTPAMRGLVKVQMGTQSAVQAESGQRVSFTPQAFAAQAGLDDVVVTRSFHHE